MLQEFSIFMMSCGNISMTRHFESFRPPVRPVPGHITLTLATTAWALDWVPAPAASHVTKWGRGTSLNEQWLTLVTPASQVSTILRVFQAYPIAQYQTLAMRWIQGEIKYTLTLDITVFLLSCSFICVPTFGIYGVNKYVQSTDFPVRLQEKPFILWSFCITT